MLKFRKLFLHSGVYGTVFKKTVEKIYIEIQKITICRKKKNEIGYIDVYLYGSRKQSKQGKHVRQMDSIHPQ